MGKQPILCVHGTPAGISRNHGDYHETLRSESDGVITLVDSRLEKLIKKGQTLIDAGRGIQAERFFRDLVKLYPDEAAVSNKLGVALAKQDKQDEALIHFKRALAKDPHLVQAYNNMGNIFLLREDFDFAEWCYTRALELDQNFSTAHNNLAALYKKQGHRSKAVEHMKKSKRSPS